MASEVALGTRNADSIDKREQRQQELEQEENKDKN